MLGQDVRLGLTETEIPSISRELVFRKLSQLLVMQAGLPDAVLPFPFSVFEQVTSCGLPFFDFDHLFVD